MIRSREEVNLLKVNKVRGPRSVSSSEYDEEEEEEGRVSLVFVFS